MLDDFFFQWKQKSFIYLYLVLEKYIIHYYIKYITNEKINFRISNSLYKHLQ